MSSAYSRFSQALGVRLTDVMLATGMLGGVLLSSSTSSAAPDLPVARIPSCLAATLGMRVIIDIPEAKDLGQPLKAPVGWTTVQATGETVKELLAYTGARVAPFVAYLDEHGNVIHFDNSDKCRATIGAGVREFERRVETTKKSLANQWSEAEKARQRNAEARELVVVRELLNCGVRGYPQIEAAAARFVEIERDRRSRFSKIMAQEGLIAKRQFGTQLEQLLDLSVGCTIEAALRRQLYWLEKSLLVAPRS